MHASAPAAPTPVEAPTVDAMGDDEPPAAPTPAPAAPSSPANPEGQTAAGIAQAPGSPPRAPSPVAAPPGSPLPSASPLPSTSPIAAPAPTPRLAPSPLPCPSTDAPALPSTGSPVAAPGSSPVPGPEPAVDSCPPVVVAPTLPQAVAEVPVAGGSVGPASTAAPGTEGAGGSSGSGSGSGNGSGSGGSSAPATAGASVGGGALAAAAPLPAVLEGFVSRDELAKRDEDSGILEFREIWNDGSEQNFVWLISLKNIIAQQLPKMPREYIVRLVLDRRHRSLVIIRTSNKQVLGGVCYRPFLEQHFAEIAFFAITSSEQVRGFGTRLMNHVKEAVKKYGITHFVTYADNYAVGYFQKQGFTKGLMAPSEIWYGYIKDYDGGTLMQCEIHRDVDYLDIPGMVRRQRKAIVDHLRQHPAFTSAYPALAPDDPRRASFDVQRVPGVEEAGWKGLEGMKLPSAEARAALRSSLVQLTDVALAHPDAWPFEEPVSEQDAPDYHEVIKDPIDLGTIRTKALDGFYKTLEMYLADLSRMFVNCRSYNRPSTPFVACADKLEAFTTARLKDIVAATKGPEA